MGKMAKNEKGEGQDGKEIKDGEDGRETEEGEEEGEDREREEGIEDRGLTGCWRGAVWPTEERCC